VHCFVGVQAKCFEIANAITGKERPGHRPVESLVFRSVARELWESTCYILPHLTIRVEYS
jgi:hypothetical protein